MARPASRHPTDGELAILQVLWQDGPSSLGHLCDALRRKRPVATTTVATILKVMLDKGLVKRTQKEKGYVWLARVKKRKTTSLLVGHLLDRAFDGSAQRLVTHLLETGQLSDEERQQLRRLLDADSRSTKSGERS